MTEYSGVRGDVARLRTLRLLAGNLKAIVDLHRLVARLGRERREAPGDDLISALVTADVDGERLSVRELGAFFDLLLVAGNETTRNALAHGLKLFTDHPDQRAHPARPTSTGASAARSRRSCATPRRSSSSSAR